jgi:hypothetical protein
MKSILIIIASYCYLLTISSTTSGAEANLLGGDCGFEAGFNGWIAHSAPAKFDYMANRSFPLRQNGVDQGELITPTDPPEGSQVLQLKSTLGKRSLVTGMGVSLQADTQYIFSAQVRCAPDAFIDQYLLPELSDETNKTFPPTTSQRHQISNQWSKINYTFTPPQTGRYFPELSIAGASTCQFDALSLTKTSEVTPDYVSPHLVSLAFIPTRHPQLGMPNLVTENLDQPADVIISLYNNQTKSLSGTLSLEAIDPYSRVISRSDRQLKLMPLQKNLLTLELTLPEVGVWRLNAHFTLTDKSLPAVITADSTLAKMRPASGPPDHFFGAHEKWHPLIETMGFGAIRDLNMMRWIEVQPHADTWVPPYPQELELINTFIDHGGKYMVTLVAEAPYKNPWSETHWGIDMYGPIPLWAGGDADTSAGMFGKVARLIKKDAIENYVVQVATRYPRFELEFMNEPNHYMSPEEYITSFQQARAALRKAGSPQPLVALATPPTWPYLAGGIEGKISPQPYKWIKEALELTATDPPEILAFHTYGRYKRDEVPENGYGGIGEAEWVKGIRNLKGAGNNTLWISEKGISTVPWKESLKVTGSPTNNRVDSPLTQARWLVRAQIEAKAKGIARYYLFNRVWSEMTSDRHIPDADRTFTLFEADGQPLPALVAQRVLIEQLSHTRLIGSGSPAPQTRYSIFQREKDRRIIGVIWSFGLNQSNEPLDLPLKFTCPSILANSKSTGLFGENLTSACEADELSVTPSPLYLLLPENAKETDAIAAFENLLSKPYAPRSFQYKSATP